MVDNLLDGVRTIIGETALRLPTTSADGSDAPGTGGGTTAAGTGRPAAGGQSPSPAVVAGPRLDGTGIAEAITPVTRPVGELTSPVLAKVASAPLVEPVVEVVRPVAEPIIDLLPPALAPVLDLTEPVIGGPEAPSAPPAGPIVGTPAPAGDAPTTGQAPTTGTSPVIARPAPPIVEVPPQATSSRLTHSSTGREKVSPGNTTSRGQWPGEPAHGPGVTPAAPATTAGAGTGAGAPGAPAEGSPRSWEPELRVLGCLPARSDELVDRPSQPDTRPA
ncbi:hypothetical protein [Micromonospora sp. I033]